MVPANNELIARIGERLLVRPDPIAADAAFVPDWMPEEPFSRPPVNAAVLIALVRRGGTYSVLYTERAGSLRNHSGQIAFPGGKIDPDDTGAADAALREAFEEVGLRRGDARVVGFMPHYFTGTNYLITPVVAVVHPDAPFVANPGEVESIFEVPLETLARLETYRTLHLKRQGRDHRTWQIQYEGYLIWGITANLTRQFYELALAGESGW